MPDIHDQALEWAQANAQDPRAQDVMAKAWASKNPDDPRSSQILQKLGQKSAEEPKTSAGMAGLESFGNAALAGYLPQLQGLAQNGVGYLADLAQGVPQEFRGGDSYTQARDQAIQRQQLEQEEHPTASTLGSIGGAIASAPGYAKLLAPLGAAAGAGTAGRILGAVGQGAATGALQNPGDVPGQISGPQFGERAQQAGVGGLLGGALQGAGEVANKLTKAVSPEALSSYAETKALKSAVVKKDFRNASKKNRVKSLGRTLLDESVDMTNPGTGEVVTQKLLEAGDTFEDIAKKTALLKQQTGAQLGSIYQQVESKLNDASFLKTLSPEQFATVKDIQMNPKQFAQDFSQQLQQKIGDTLDGPEIMERMGKYIDRIGKKGEYISLKDALKLKNELDSKIDHSKMIQDLPGIQKALFEMRNAIRDKMNDIVSKVGSVVGDDLGNKLLKANKVYGNASALNKMSAEKMASENANRMFGLTDTIAGGAGAGTGAILGAASGHAGPEAAALGAVGAIGNKLARTYGNPILARGANAASQALEKTPLGAIGDRAQQGTQGLVQSGLLGNIAPRLKNKNSK